MAKNQTLARTLAVNKTVAEIAAHVGGRLVGDGSLRIESVAGLAQAGPRDISFLSNPKYAEAAAVSTAGCLLLPPIAEKAPGLCQNRIIVDDPQYAYSQVLQLIESQRPKRAAGVHATAVVHPSARIGEGASIGPLVVVEQGAQIGAGTVLFAQCFVGEGVTIGRDCKIYAQVVIREGCALGDRVIVQPGVVIGGDGYGFSTDRKTGKHRKIPQLGNVVLGDDVEVQANTTIDRAALESTVIGAGTKIDNLVQVAHNVRVGRDVLLVAQCGVAGSTKLGDCVVIGGQVGVAGHIEIGDGAQVAAQSGVMSDTAGGKAYFGSPIKPHREAFKLLALYGKLPELFDAVKLIKQKLGINDGPEA